MSWHRSNKEHFSFPPHAGVSPSKSQKQTLPWKRRASASSMREAKAIFLAWLNSIVGPGSDRLLLSEGPPVAEKPRDSTKSPALPVPGSVKLVRRSLRLLKRNKPSEGFFGNNLDYAVVPDFEQRSQHHSRVGNVSGELRAHCGLSALVAEPQQMCSCPLSPTSLGRRWNLWAGSASRPANSLPSPLPQARAGTLWAMGSALDHTHEERRCKA